MEFKQPVTTKTIFRILSVFMIATLFVALTLGSAVVGGAHFLATFAAAAFYLMVAFLATAARLNDIDCDYDYFDSAFFRRNGSKHQPSDGWY